MSKHRIKENRGGTWSLVDKLTNAELQRECRSCRELRLVEDYQRYSSGHLRAHCRECFREIQRETSKKHRLNRKINNFNERALEKGLEGNFTVEQYKELISFAGGRCMITNEVLTPETTQLDHVISLSKLVVGSTASNVWLVDKRVNQLKWTYSLTHYLNSKHGVNNVDKKRLAQSISYLADKEGVTFEEYIDLLIESENISLISKTFFNN
ncbi:hypothetical protein CBR56_07695 [Bacillus thuringiensis]|uniref:hypothetical protein n=1 Tax=Bacillus tropicus TaxID=2026188 RepID=UPI000B440FC4|nr:hypothetical protein [Bacillus tropicus]MED3037254.1 hypothetical protein [Bacillus tropicus]OTX85113.1 hypothetical protein BK728_10825 [Bacillus thuringiensis serovar chanpaisis]PNK31477.1 hypothetical protein CBR56_07695 [Bacillus thuringiensis]